MSRSYKKTPSCGDSNDKAYKRHANKVVRNACDVPNGSAYKKYSQPWDIKDFWTHHFTFAEWLKRCKKWQIWDPDYVIDEDAEWLDYEKQCLRK